MEMVQVGELLREARAREGVSQGQLARRAGTTQTVVSRIERGKTTPTIGMLERLLLALGYELHIDASEIQGEHDPRHLADDVALPVEDRLARGLDWIEFAHELRAAAARPPR